MYEMPMHAIAARNKESDFHWFDRDTMRFFQTRVGQTAYATADGQRAYFVSSEQQRPDWHGNTYRRLYSVRVADLGTGKIDTVGKFQGYKTRSAATREAKRLASEG